MDHTQLDKAAEEWLRLDRVRPLILNPTTRAEITALQDAKDYTSLSARLSSRITFGTAGLRSRMAAGTSNMNDLTVIQATQGLARYAIETIQDAQTRGVVVGRDHRAVEGLSSERFASLTAGVFRREGFKVYEYDGLVHTPMVPFATSRLKAALGVMITASHNPAADNGYKVYWENAVQIIPPHDAGIAARIEQSLEVDEEVWTLAPDPSPWQGTEEMKSEYIKHVAGLASTPELNSNPAWPCPLFTYTAMHGVGLPFATAAFEASGFPLERLSIVESQAQPDPTFPTVRFPNPEEPGALKLAMAHADKVGSTLVLANDPDADRFTAAERYKGKWNAFTGDQIGALLASWALSKYQESGKPIEKLAMCASTVSSKMIRAMAKKEGFVFRETLTGFKYLGNEVLKLKSEGYNPVFAYEEAIGYLHGDEIHDKDGVSALTSFVEMATALSRLKKEVTTHLDSLYFEYGYHKTSNSYFISRDPAKTNKIFNALRYGDEADPATIAASPVDSLKLPKTLGGFTIASIRDLTVGYDSSNPPSFTPTLPVDPHTHMITFTLVRMKDGVEVVGTVRTSGTEPKIKFYLEASGESRSFVDQKLAAVREAIGQEWLRWEEFGLEKA